MKDVDEDIDPFLKSFLSKLSAPARRALEAAGLSTFKKFSNVSEKEILKLHGMGPKSIPILRKELKSVGLTFKKIVFVTQCIMLVIQQY